MSSVLSKAYKAVLQPHKIPRYARRRADAYLRTVSATRVAWPEPGRALLVDFTLHRPVGSEVLVLTEASLVSPGTERAYFNALPGARVVYPFFPGYSGAGVIADVGPEVTRFRVGDVVAGPLPHASAMLLDEVRLVAVPPGIPADHAAFVQLGVIALQGVRKARIGLGDRVTVLGQGLIGLLTTQLALQNGAHEVAAITTTPGRLPLAAELGATTTISLDRNVGSLSRLAADVTIDTTGNPDALHSAIVSTRPGGRIVLLGSSRGVTRGIDFRRLRERQLTLLGAHVDSLPTTHSSRRSWTVEKEATTFLRLLEDRRVDVSSLITHAILPGEAERFYRQLSRSDPSILGAVFRWNQVPHHLRLRGRGISSAAPVRVVQVGLPPGAAPPSEPSAGSPAPRVQTRALRVGLIGCGEIAVHNARAIHDSDNAKLVMAADVNPSIASDMGKRYDIPSTTQVEELLARSDVDAVLISVPHYLHAPLTIRAAQYGKHVMVEKPMATTVAEADEMVAACHKAGVELSVIYCQRYLPYVQRAKHLIQQGALGKILGVQLDFRMDKPPGYFSSGFSGRVHSDWRMSREKSGGGLLIFNLVHYLDIIRYLTNLSVTHVHAEFDALDTPVETEDTISVTLRYSNKAIGNIMGSSVVRGAAYQPGLRLWGTDGQFDLREPDEHRIYSLRQIEGLRPGVWHPLDQLGTSGDRQAYVSRFARSVLAGTQPEVSGHDGRAIQAIVEAIYASGERGTGVEVDQA